MDEKIKRYSDAELAEFKILIDSKMEKAKSELGYYQEQIMDLSENVNDDSDDWSESSSAMSDLELLTELAQRQVKIIENLQRALLRIRNKTYGICEATGALIEKQRLLVEPTLTNSMKAKNTDEDLAFEYEDEDLSMIQDDEFDFISNFDDDEEDDHYISLDDIADEYGYEDEYDI
ncbi:MAG: hypothetical protein KDC85_03780 [Saprospiraceae bacterium]|nr:hypothetical protein [Saprospiraceae bacterium]MCB9326776.1 hypothetical protein [Lewinellaceae bacterium]